MTDLRESFRGLWPNGLRWKLPFYELFNWLAPQKFRFRFSAVNIFFVFGLVLVTKITLVMGPEVLHMRPCSCKNHDELKCRWLTGL